jgi:hypothetical protein
MIFFSLKKTVHKSMCLMRINCPKSARSYLLMLMYRVEVLVLLSFKHLEGRGLVVLPEADKLTTSHAGGGEPGGLHGPVPEKLERLDLAVSPL